MAKKEEIECFHEIQQFLEETYHISPGREQGTFQALGKQVLLEDRGNSLGLTKDFLVTLYNTE